MLESHVMKRVIIKYGIGYGRHKTGMDVEDDSSEEEIEAMVKEAVMERLDWSWEIQEAD